MVDIEITSPAISKREICSWYKLDEDTIVATDHLVRPLGQLDDLEVVPHLDVVSVQRGQEDELILAVV